LRLSGYQVVITSTLADGLSLAKGVSFDLYLLDNWLPDGSGIELCRRIRVFDGSTPIVFYSGAAFQSDYNQAMDAGAQEYLVKPSGFEEIVGTISLLLDRTKCNQPEPIINF